jgi:hypothetical protein
MAAGQPSGTDKVPVTTSGKPDYNYYAEMMNAADRNDAYARDLINLKEQARMAAIDAAARGEKFRFVPVKDYMNNRVIFVNAGGNDVVLDMNDPRQGVEYQKLLDKAGVDSATMTDWMHRSSRPMLRYMQPAGGARDVTPDFGYARRSVEMGEGNAAASPSNFKLPDIAHVTEGMPKVGKFGESRGMDLESDNVAQNKNAQGRLTHDGYPARMNPDGSYSTELSVTVTDPRLNGGRPTNIPSLWKGKEVDEDEAVANALSSGKQYQAFGSIPEAVKAAEMRSAQGGAAAPTQQEMPTPTATPPSTRPEPQPTAVASVAPQPEEDLYAENLKRLEEQRKAKGITPAQGRRIDQSKKWL